MDQHQTASQSPSSLDIVALIEQLSSSDLDACRNAMKALGPGYLSKHIAHAEILTGLMRALDAPLQDARSYAAFHLADFGPDATPAVPRLTALIDDVFSAVDALGAIGSKAQSSIPALRSAMLSQRHDIQHRERIALTLARIGTTDILTIAAITEVVGEYLDDWSRRYPFDSGRRLLFPWIQLLTDKYAPATHEVARSVLIWFGVRAARDIMDELLPRHHRSKDYGPLPRLCLDVVRDIGKPAMPALIAAAAPRLYYFHFEPWTAIIDLMRDLDPGFFSPPGICTALQDDQSDVRQGAAEFLMSMPAAFGVDPVSAPMIVESLTGALVKDLHAEGKSLRRSTASRLIRLTQGDHDLAPFFSPRDLSWLLPKLRPMNHQVIGDLLTVWAWTSKATWDLVAPVALEGLQNPDSRVRIAALALSPRRAHQPGGDSEIPQSLALAVYERMKNDNVSVRARAARVMCRFVVEFRLEALSQALDDRDWRVRLAVVRNTYAPTLLLKACQDRRRIVRSMALSKMPRSGPSS